MIKIRAEARCPETYYQELIMDITKFDKMTKMELVAFINVNSDEDEQVTIRPRKSTLVRLAKKIAVSQSTKAGCSGWYEKHDSDIPVLYKMAEEACDPKKSDNMLDRFMGGTLLLFTKVFIAIIALEFLNAATLDLPPGEFFGVLAVLFLLVGIPLRVWLWERG